MTAEKSEGSKQKYLYKNRRKLGKIYYVITLQTDIFIYSSFNDSISSSDDITSDGKSKSEQRIGNNGEGVHKIV
jgi:hypothetical protein